MLQHHRSELTILRAVLAGLRLELAAIKFGLALEARRRRDLSQIDAASAAGQSALNRIAGKYNSHHDDRGRFTTAEGATSGGGETDAERDSSNATDSNKPIRLAQVGGAETMTGIGNRVPVGGGAIFQAPAGEQISSFTVSPLTNNIYQTPLGPVDVTGWTAYYGPPGTVLINPPAFGSHQEPSPNGVLRFVNPNDGRNIITRQTFTGN